MKLILFDKTIKRKEILQISIEELVEKVSDFDPNVKRAFLSAANSLGFMDGGSDLGYMKVIPSIQKMVQTGFRHLNFQSGLGRFYLPIGCAMGFKVPNKNFYFVSCPTMFLPQKVTGTLNPYHSLSAGLTVCKHLDIQEIYCPMMCTGWGGIPVEEVFKQMKDATVLPLEISEKNGYSFAMKKLEDIKRITDTQPKEYCNSEFFVDIGYDLKMKKPWKD
jgi:O-acetyl-ADP-ribose deacetylase (regulator of RNase III)